MPEDQNRAALLQQFQAAIAGMSPVELRQVLGTLTQVGEERLWPNEQDRPNLRRPPRQTPAVYRVRVDLDGARPPIWRRLHLRSDVTLDVVHDVLQTAFGWLDYHLHRFSLGGGPFDADTDQFLCPFDVQEGEDDGTPAKDVRLDETLQVVDDVLHYAYDYGDGWELTLRLEEVLPLEADTPTAVCVDGRRAAPPEDCGGIRDAAGLAQVLDDPAHFDPDEVNQALHNPFAELRDVGVHPALVELLNRLRGTRAGNALVVHALESAKLTAVPDRDQLTAALRPIQWFLDRAADGGIELTSAGYLKPVDVEEASRVVPTMDGWIGTKNREIHCAPLLYFRQSLQHTGLLRKYKGRLLLTKAGAAARRDVGVLWRHLAEHLVPRQDRSFEAEAGLLRLLQAAVGGDSVIDDDLLFEALDDRGWRYSDGEPIERWALYRLEHSPTHLLNNVADQPTNSRDRSQGPVAVALARAALLTGR